MALIGYTIHAPIPHDSDIERDRMGRLLCSAAGWAVTLALSYRIGGYLASYTGNETVSILGSCLGLALGGIAFAPFFVNSMLISNGGQTGNVTTDQFAGEQVIYGPGLHLAYPWETRAKSWAFPLKTATKEFDVNITTKTSRLIAKCEVQWRYSLPRLMRAVNLTEGTLKYNLEGFVDGILNRQLSGLTGAQALTRVLKINKALEKDFMGSKHKKTGIKPSEFETEYGLEIVTVFMKHFEFSEEVQKARNAVAVAQSVHEIAAALYEPGDLDADLKSGKLDLTAYTALVNLAFALAGLAKLNIVSLGGADTFAKGMMGVIAAKGGI